MATVKRILQAIVDNPGFSGAQLGDMLDLDAKDIQPRIHTYISDGRVRCEKKPMDGSSPINLYYASPELVKEFDGTNQTVTKAVRKVAHLPVATDGFVCGFSTAGRLTITKGRKTIDLTREETARLLAFVDCINIEAIAGSQA
ncbi:hypothetical protein DN523_29145 [Burkholderia multivorans]|uniref:hypothetical protein n=1 Tax=Burkholderia multivorans TaxID=87883 RepID=UPI000DACAD72|nr:hypothetical protein [Burkholderia multivorans]MBU9231417.1 hypothetical protein [Burkholderia multivorans]RAA31170.1 hypothetical protein DN471_06365 [Burkholderia multivorans]RAA32552.1 hypothetical protein DN470_01165 [Burkholderia multivorans]RAA37249.1 hypothetical protein DN465_05890 [Burkholderia multivorans]RAA38198.1 hypothetical protein DN472_26795 [Burkholderia multivorans]